MKKGVAIIAINANSTETHPQDGPLEMRQLGLDYGWRFPYLFDETQEVAKSYTQIFGIPQNKIKNH